jgi:hypothetical protein
MTTTYVQLVEDLIGEEATKRLLGPLARANVQVDGSLFVVHRHGVVAGYCIGPRKSFLVSSVRPNAVDNAVERDLSRLYPVLALMITNPEEFMRRSNT